MSMANAREKAAKVNERWRNDEGADEVEEPTRPGIALVEGERNEPGGGERRI